MKCLRLSLLFLAATSWQSAQTAENTFLTGSASSASAHSQAAADEVTKWIQGRVPQCPPAAAAGASQRFLDELKTTNPIALAQISAESFSFQPYESRLLRLVGTQLTTPDSASLRELVARQRLEALTLLDEGRLPSATEISEMWSSVKGVSDVYLKRLVEGRMDDDDLRSLLKRARQAKAPVAQKGAPKEKVLTASDIVSEYSQRNQKAGAARRLRSYVIDSGLSVQGAKPQRLVLSRMAGKRFRLQVFSDNKASVAIFSDGMSYWSETPSKEAKMILGSSIEGLKVLGEFIDPLFVPEGFVISRLGDGLLNQTKVYRLSVTAPDGTSYVACLDTVEFRQVGRENPDGSKVTYSNFKDVSGVTFAFKEESVDKAGKRSVLEVTRVAVNCGLFEELFRPATTTGLNYFVVSDLVQPATAKK